jgi:hypothetical protein
MVYRAFMQFGFLPTSAARTAFGKRLGDIAVAAFRAIAQADKGLEVAHLQFRRGRDLVAICSRVTGDGEVEIEIDVGNGQLPTVVFTENEMRRANRRSRDQGRGIRRPYDGTVFHISR